LRYNSEPSTCFSGSSNYYGEIEDYCANINLVSTSTNTINPASQLHIFPNPFGKEFVVSLKLLSSALKAQLEVWNAQGQMVHNRTLAIPGNTVLQETITAHDWPKGLYMVRLRNGNEEAWGKVLKVE